jgi:hypothetical protein
MMLATATLTIKQRLHQPLQNTNCAQCQNRCISVSKQSLSLDTHEADRPIPTLTLHDVQNLLLTLIVKKDRLSPPAYRLHRLQL